MGTMDQTTKYRTEATNPADFLDDAKHAAAKVAGKATEQIEQRLDSEKNRAAEAIGGVADALRQNAETKRGAGPAGDLAARAADGIDDVADFLQSRSLRDVVGEVERFARREPAIFLGAAFALGLVGGRFLKSSASRQPEARNRMDGRSMDRGGEMNRQFGFEQGSYASSDRGFDAGRQLSSGSGRQATSKAGYRNTPGMGDTQSNIGASAWTRELGTTGSRPLGATGEPRETGSTGSSSTAGSNTMGSGTAGSSTTGSSAAGSNTTGSSAAGANTTAPAPGAQRSETKAGAAGSTRANGDKTRSESGGGTPRSGGEGRS